MSVLISSGDKGSNYQRSLSSPLLMLQAEKQLKLFAGLTGNYRIYGWNRSQGVDFTGDLAKHTGIGMSIDQRLGDGITLFGRYATPVKDFTNVEQPDLRAAYEGTDADVRPLPFRFGYRWRTQVDNLMLAERPRRPYKSPVIR
mgnify:CR=1 FL=1